MTVRSGMKNRQLFVLHVLFICYQRLTGGTSLPQGKDLQQFTAANKVCPSKGKVFTAFVCSFPLPEAITRRVLICCPKRRQRIAGACAPIPSASLSTAFLALVSLKPLF
jgi:hypothetical protein